VGLDGDYRKVPLGVMITHKDHPNTGEIEFFLNKLAEEKPPV
jgi:hypothetical protein